jgi:hypothetical protein
MYDKIPDELKAINAWLVWRYEDIGSAKPTKVPYNARTGKLASVNDPATWCDFDYAVTMVRDYNGIGFVFRVDNGYTFIDLDYSDDPVVTQRQIKIFQEFDSYAEISPSGRGLHIIVRGTVPSGRRRSFVEVYSHARYATFTGNVYHNIGIAERQALVTQLWEQMGSGPATHLYTGDEREKYTDAEILAQAKAAVNGEKFLLLQEGKWQDLYPSQSEADIAYIDIVAFYTQNRNQIERLFSLSGLGQRAKARRPDYIQRMILRSFDRMLPPVDIEGFQQQLELKLAEGKKEVPNAEPELPLQIHDAAIDNAIQDLAPIAHTQPLPGLQLPPGLVGEIAQFIYRAAVRPVPEIALSAAFALMSGVCGRAYNISSTGLNQYFLTISATGNGKEDGVRGIDKIMNAIALINPTSKSYIGPAEIASGQALLKHLNNHSQCFISMLGEIGIRLQQMCGPHASSAEVTLRRMLLDLYNKSGLGQKFRGSIYADSAKNITDTDAPCFVILGDSTPEKFYGALEESMISEGLLSRFVIIEYNGPRPPLNKQHGKVQLPFELIDKFSALLAQCETLSNSNPRRIIEVDADQQSQAELDRFEIYTTNLVNKSPNDMYRQLWTRAHVKALKISALLAVGVNYIKPVITMDHVEYAINLVRNDIRALSDKFERGLIGSTSNEMHQVNEIIRVVKDYVTLPFDKVKNYSDTAKMHRDKVVPYMYISRRLIAIAAFRHDKQGSTSGIKRALKLLTEGDKLRELPKSQMQDKYGTTQLCFIVSDPSILKADE